MKRFLLATCVPFGLLASVAAMAMNLGIVDMNQLQNSPQMRKINEDLNNRFTPQRNRIMEMSKSLQSNMEKLQRNEAVMDKKTADTLRNDIKSAEEDLRNEQMKFQQKVYSAQNEAMSDFMDNVNKAVKKVAEKKNFDLVLPKNAILFSKDSTDITSDVMNKL